MLESVLLLIKVPLSWKVVVAVLLDKFFEVKPILR